MNTRLLRIYTEGDQARGLGHVVRCRAIADGWRAEGGAVAWVLDGDDQAVRACGDAGPVALASWQGSSSFQACDVAVVDSYSASTATLQAIAASARHAVFLDDVWRADLPPGLIVHAAPDPMPASLSPVQRGQDWLCGPAWHPLRAAFRSLSERSTTRETVEQVLVLPGGTDVRAMGPTLAAHAATAFPNATVHLVGQQQNRGLTDASIKVHTFLSAEALAGLMQTVDLAISAAGTTLFELARCGVPTVMIGMAQNQQPNLDHLPGLCGFVAAGHSHDENLTIRLDSGLARLADPLVRHGISERAQALVDGLAVDRLLQRLDRLAAA